MTAKNNAAVSVVIASHNARASIEECLSALAGQREAADAEIIIVDNSTDGTTEVIRAQFSRLKLIVEQPSALIPELWSAGIRQSSGEIVAITTAHFIPDRNWLVHISRAHRDGRVAVGGAIENDAGSGVVDWAVYFCRYAPYMLPFREGSVAEIAGDNASYKRIDIDRCLDAWADGFWETAVHAELKKAGFRLVLAPSIVVRHKRSFGFGDFMSQRFRHGIQFGRMRASRFSLAKRATYMMLSPAIPVLFLGRIMHHIVKKQRYRGKFLQALPVLIFFLLAWTMGEVVGYLKGRVK